MAVSFAEQATNQLAPAYKPYKQALQAQIPAIQQLYQSLFQGLEGTGRRENQNILEDASGRGLLRSTIPVDSQALLQESLLAKRGELGAAQAKEIGGIRTQIAGVGVDQANAISQLAQALAASNLQRQQFGFQKQQSNQQYRLSKSLADREYALQKQALNY